jgi:LEA14-like dessication related protein
MTMQIFASRIAVPAAFLTIVACAGTGIPITSPEVRLTSIEMTSADFDSQTFLLGFDVSNPNPFPLPVTSVSYRVLLGDQQFASGQTRGSFTVPSNGGSSFVVSVELDLLRTTTRLGSFFPGRERQDLSYELSGSLMVDIPFSKPLDFSHSDSIDMLAASM